MELSREFMLELVRSREFADFTFTVPGGEDHKVHRLILSARSPVLGHFFQKHDKEADLFDLFTVQGHKDVDGPDQYTNLALRAAMADVFSYCYLDDYSNTYCNASTDFTTRVLSHLLIHGLANRFDISGLVELSSHHFKKAFLWYCANSTSENVKSALQQCSSEGFVKESGLTEYALGLLRNSALAAFTNQIGVYKTSGRFKEALELMEAVPLATAYVYSRPSTREDMQDDGGESDGDEEKDVDGFEEERHDRKRAKEEYETG